MKRDNDVELLSAYVDGISELSLAERKSLDDLLARDPALRAQEVETRALIGELRDLSPAGGEPDWTALERGIGAAVASLPARTWWQRFRWRIVVPGVALAMTAAILALVMRPPAEPPVPAPAPTVEATPVLAPDDATDELGASIPLWLDGTDLDVALEAAELFDLDVELDPEDVPATAELLPPTDLEWVDELDDEALDRAEQFLEHPRPNPRGPS